MNKAHSARHAPSRTPLALVASVGASLAASVPSAHAQSTIEWATPVDGDFSVAGNWLPMVVPGALDTAVLGGVGPYMVSTSARTVGFFDLANPDAVLAVLPGVLNIGGAMGDGTIVVNRTQSTDRTDLVLNDGAEVGIKILLNTSPDSTDLLDAVAYWSQAGDVPRITEDGVLTGRGAWYYALQNDGVIESLGDDGYVRFVQAPVTQGATGVVRSTDGGTIGLGASSVLGGTWDGGTDGRLAGEGSLGEATVTGVWGVEPGSTITLRSAIDGDGTIVVNRTQSTDRTDLVLNDGAEVGIKILLNTSPDSTDLLDAVAYWSQAGARPTLTANGAIAGRGLLYYALDVAGTLSPGDGDDDVSLLQLSTVDFDLTHTARIAIDVGGTDPTEYDRIAGSGAITLNGSLDVNFVDGYVPQGRDQFEIISATTVDGSFASTTIEPVGAIGPAHIVYTGTGVIVVICAADRDADGELTIFDFLAFQSLFGAGDLRADLDEDGQLTIFDFLVFQNRFAAGCP